MVLLFALVAAAPCHAQTPPLAPSIADLQQRIDRVNADNSLSESEKTETLEQLELAIKKSQAADEQEQQAKQFAAELLDAPRRQTAFAKQADQITVSPLAEDLTAAPMAELEALLTKEQAELAQLVERSREIDAAIKKEKSFDIAAALAKAREQLRSGSIDAASADASQDAAKALASTTRRLQQARVVMLEQRLLSRKARLAALAAEADLLAKQIRLAESRQTQLQQLIADHQQSDANKMLGQAKATLQSLDGEPDAIHELARDNVQLARDLVRLVARHDDVIAENARATASAQDLERKYKSLNEQLEIAQLETSPEFGAALRKLRDQLVDADNTRRALRAHEKTLTKSRLAQFQLEELRDTDVAASAATVIAALRSDTAQTLSAEQERLVEDLISERDAIQQKLAAAYAGYIDDLSSLTAQQRAVIEQSQQYANLLDQHLLWMPSANAMGLDSLSGLVASLAWLTDPQSWQDVGGTIVRRIKRFPATALICAGVAVLLFRRKPALTELLAAMKNKVGKVNRDSSTLTPIALLASLLLALPLPLAIYAAARLVHDPGTFSGALSSAMTYSAVVLLVLEFVRQCVRKKGVAELHFKWSDSTVHGLRRNLPWFITAFMPAVLLNLLVEAGGAAEIRDSLGRVAFVAATLLIATFAYRLLQPGQPALTSELPAAAEPHWQIRYIMLPLFVFLPLLIAGLSIYGYHYTAVQLDAYLVNSLLALLAAILIYYLAQRELAISERRLTLEQVRAKRAAALAKAEDRAHDTAAGEGLPTAVDLEEIDLQTLSDQTRALLKLVIMVLLGIALWRVWSGFFPAFQPLDDIELWQVVELVDDAPFSIAITLWDALLAIAIAIITFLAAKNIPGLLEIAVLSRLSTETGTSYAITTVSRYVIVITGSIIALQLLGAQWSKLQWLVAALGVGLGFGLQEIVANFVSGIVILFERPIRIGDTVTVGDQSGTVSKIRIRATTIVDWDRREVIIPNKTFITERLVNWTLSDPITRATINVGVAYGSDAEQVETLLLQIAADDPKVIADPKPTAVFMNFGDSTLDFQLRVFVQGIQDMVMVAHALRGEIARVFHANGIEIAFPQRDIHFDPRPIEVRLVDRKDGQD